MGRRPLLLAIVLALAGVSLWWAWSPPGANELVSGDEGYYGNMARNVVASPRYLVSPSLWPAGPPGDKPPLYPAILSLPLRLLGANETAVRGPSFVFAAITAIALALLLARACGPWAGAAVVALLVTLPWYADASRGAAAEIPTTTFGTLALLVLAANPASRARGALAGVLLGLAFLCKLWLVAPFALACVALVGFERRSLPALAWLVAGASLTGSLHGLAVLAFAPADAGHWLQIYFGRSLLERAGTTYVGGWVKHPAFYWSLLLHASALAFPLAVAGAEAALRRWREPGPRALFAWAAALALLSAFAAKSGIYAYVIVPAWIGLAAFGAWSLARGGRPSLLAIGIGLLASAPWLLPGEAGQRVQWTVWALAWVAALAAWAIVRRWPKAAVAAATALVALACAGGLAREAQRLPVRYNTPGLRELARAVEPALAHAPAGQECFVGPEAPALAFYTNRRGAYWWTPQMPWTRARGAAIASDSTLRAFVVDTRDQMYGGSPDSTTLGWLERQCTEVTPQFRARLGRETPLRVFVRP